MEAGVPSPAPPFISEFTTRSGIGARILWRKGLAEAELDTYAYGRRGHHPISEQPPCAISTRGAEEVRRRLDDPTSAGPGLPLYDELRREGLTEYSSGPCSYARASGTR